MITSTFSHPTTKYLNMFGYQYSLDLLDQGSSLFQRSNFMDKLLNKKFARLKLNRAYIYFLRSFIGKDFLMSKTKLFPCIITSLLFGNEY